MYNNLKKDFDNVFWHYMFIEDVKSMDKWALWLEEARRVKATRAELFAKKTLDMYMQRVKDYLDIYRNRFQKKDA